VSLSTPTATRRFFIYYTTDGSQPTTASVVYARRSRINAPTTVKAFATAVRLDRQPVTTASYQILALTVERNELDVDRMLGVGAAVGRRSGGKQSLACRSTWLPRVDRKPRSPWSQTLPDPSIFCSDRSCSVRETVPPQRPPLHIVRFVVAIAVSGCAHGANPGRSRRQACGR